MAEREKPRRTHGTIRTDFCQNSPAIRLHDRFVLSSLEEVGSESNDNSDAQRNVMQPCNNFAPFAFLLKLDGCHREEE